MFALITLIMYTTFKYMFSKIDFAMSKCLNITVSTYLSLGVQMEIFTGGW